MRALTTPSSDSSSPRFSEDTAWLEEARGPGRGEVWRRGGCECPHDVSCMISYIKWIFIFCEFTSPTCWYFILYEFSEFIHVVVDKNSANLPSSCSTKKMKSRWIHRYLVKFLVLQCMLLGCKRICQKTPHFFKQIGATMLLLYIRYIWFGYSHARSTWMRSN